MHSRFDFGTSSCCIDIQLIVIRFYKIVSLRTQIFLPGSSIAQLSDLHPITGASKC